MTSVDWIPILTKILGAQWTEKSHPPEQIVFCMGAILHNVIAEELTIGTAAPFKLYDFYNEVKIQKGNSGGSGLAIGKQIIAEKIKAELQAFGFTNEELSKLKPEVAQNILASLCADPIPGFEGFVTPCDLTSPAHRKGIIEFWSLPVEDLGEGIPDRPAIRDEWNALVDQARGRDMIDVAQAHGVQLRKSGTEYIGVKGCPVCGTGDDRFAINPRKHLFNCRGCGKGGGGPIDLEMFLGGCEFVEAIKRLTNTTSLNAPRRSTVTNGDPAQRERENEQYEAKQHQKAGWLWARRQPAIGSPVERYLRSRGYTGAIPPTIGYLPARGKHQHAMISAFALPNEVAPGELGAPLVVRSVHLTKLKPDGSDRIHEDKGKIVIGRPLGLPIAVSAITDGLSLAITEGTEDALTYRAAGFAAWAAGSAPSISSLVDSIPDYVTSVTIEQHVDTDEQAQRAVTKLKVLLTERPVRKGERPIEIVVKEARP